MSVAVQVTVVLAIGKMAPGAGEQLAARAPSTLSLAEAEKGTLAPAAEVASLVIFAGTVTTGAVVSASVTIMLKDAEALLPCKSVALHVTAVVVTGKVVPDAGEQDGVIAPSTVSLALAVKLTARPAGLGVDSVLSAGTEMVGAVVSTTSTWKVAVPVLPCASVALHVTDVVPNENVDPEPAEQEGVMLPSTLSFAAVAKVTFTPEAEVASRAMSPGVETAGGVVSSTVTWNELLPTSPPVFVALHETVVVPSGKTSPELWSHVGFTAGSLLVTVKVTAAPAAAVASVVMSAGTPTSGASAETGTATNAATMSTPSAASPCRTRRSRWLLRCTLGPATTDAGYED